MQIRGYRVDRVSVVGMYGVVEYYTFARSRLCLHPITTHRTLGTSASIYPCPTLNPPSLRDAHHRTRLVAKRVFYFIANFIYQQHTKSFNNTSHGWLEG